MGGAIAGGSDYDGDGYDFLIGADGLIVVEPTRARLIYSAVVPWWIHHVIEDADVTL